MSFLKLLKNTQINEKVVAKNTKIDKKVVKVISEKKEETPEEILRGANIKIKLVTPTSFGTQIDLAKKYDDDDIEDLLKDFTIKIKNKSVFVVD